MPNRKRITICGMNTKIWALFMALFNLGLGIFIIIDESMSLARNDVNPELGFYITCGFINGVLNIVAGCILINALIQAKEKIVLLYIRVEYVNLLVITVFVVLYLYMDISIIRWGLLAACPILWRGLYLTYDFYFELSSYNRRAVVAGVEEIACNTHTNPLVAFPEKAVDTTTV